MKTDHFSRICLVAITGLLAAIALRPTLAPTDAYAARHYNYELVQVVDSTTTSVKDTLAKYTKDGWEPVCLSMYATSSSSQGLGFLLLRK